jgi:hypothetical protein
MRPLGIYIAGNPGNGKSSLIQRLVLRDIKSGAGVCVIDPTSDLVRPLAEWVPQKHVDRTIYFDTENPVPIDFFSYDSPGEREVLTDQLLDVFNLDNAPVSRPRLQRILGTLFDANENPKITDEDRCTFLDIQNFIDNPKRKDEILSYAPQREQQWRGTIKPQDYVSITERLSPFFESPTLRAMFECKRPKLNIAEVMRKNLVLLIRLRDFPTDRFIGSLISAKFQQAAFAREAIPNEADRSNYHLYIDECHTILKYAVESFEQILTRARKYKLCLVLANQLPSDLPKEIQRKLGTIGTKILFQLENPDGRIFAHHFPSPRPARQWWEDDSPPDYLKILQALPKFRALVLPSLLTIRTPKFLPSYNSASYAEKIKKRTMDQYACTNGKDVMGLEDNAPTSATANAAIPAHLLPDCSKAEDPPGSG